MSENITASHSDNYRCQEMCATGAKRTKQGLFGARDLCSIHSLAGDCALPPPSGVYKSSRSTGLVPLRPRGKTFQQRTHSLLLCESIGRSLCFYPKVTPESRPKFCGSNSPSCGMEAAHSDVSSDSGRRQQISWLRHNSQRMKSLANTKKIFLPRPQARTDVQGKNSIDKKQVNSMLSRADKFYCRFGPHQGAVASALRGSGRLRRKCIGKHGARGRASRE
ncbi:Protein of unknown function [Gryllus bimaculatus]|nr:Protein of unknown function [Gryllus bimaculatus]